MIIWLLIIQVVDQVCISGKNSQMLADTMHVTYSSVGIDDVLARSKNNECISVMQDALKATTNMHTHVVPCIQAITTYFNITNVAYVHMQLCATTYADVVKGLMFTQYLQ